MIKVSVIVPVYNGEKYIDRCMQCLTGQTLQETELILVNDASTDKSGELLENWRKKYPDKIKLICSEVNRGAGGARNLGIALARGEYIGFVDCDDVVDETMYDRLYQKAAEEDCDIVDCAYYEESSRKSVLSYGDEVTGNLDDGKRGQIIAGVGYAVTKIFRASLLKGNNLRIREGVIYEDLDFLIHAALLAERVGNVKSVLYYYKNNEQSSSKSENEQKKFADMLAALEAVDVLRERFSTDLSLDSETGNNVAEAMEYAMLSCFSCAIGMCLLNQENPSFQLIENIRLLKNISAGRWKKQDENIYMQKNMTEENKELLRWFETLKINNSGDGR